MKNGIILNIKYSADDEMKKNDYIFNYLIKINFILKKLLFFHCFVL